MKRFTTIIFCLLCLLANNIQGQIALEQSFSKSETDEILHKLSPVSENIPGYNIQGYMLLQSDTSIQLYDAEYNTTKSFAVPQTETWKLNSIYLASAHLFNMDDKVEMLLLFENKTNPPYIEYKAVIYDEDGAEITELGDYEEFTVMLVTDKFKLLCKRQIQGYNNSSGMFQYSYDIFSLGGELQNTTTKSSNLKVGQSFLKNAYPNPAKGKINLTYRVNETSQMLIYSASGKHLDSKQITPNREEIELDVSQYAPGTYFYKFGETYRKFLVK
jgi:hypothetical protein